MSITEIIQAKKNYIGLTGASRQDIQDAENALGLQFAEDYIAYVSTLGVASFDGHELTGICSFERLNVVSVTLKERSANPYLFAGLYVIEQQNIDGRVIWQDSSGTIYETISGSYPVRLCATLLEYIDL